MSLGLLLLPLFCLQFSLLAEGLKTVYMTENCDRSTIRVSRVMDSIKLKWSRSYRQGYITCSTILETYHNHTSIRVKNRYLKMYFEKIRTSDQTEKPDGLQIFKGVGNNFPMTDSGYGIYPTYELHEGWERRKNILREYTSEPLSALKLIFEGEINREITGFIAVVTSYTKATPYQKCSHDEFLCEYSKICISRKLLCDGYMHCGLKDNSNNENCPNDSPGRIGYQKSDRNIDIGLVLGCIVAIFILLVAVLWLGIVCIQRSKLTNSNSSRRENNQNTHVERASIAENVLVAPTVVAPFWEPPPLYQEAIDTNSVRNSSTFELPPPYQPQHRRVAEDCLDLVSNDALAEEYANVHNTPRTNDSDTEETEVDDDKDEEVTRHV